MITIQLKFDLPAKRALARKLVNFVLDELPEDAAMTAHERAMLLSILPKVRTRFATDQGSYALKYHEAYAFSIACRLWAASLDDYQALLLLQQVEQNLLPD
jgi:hypothetical protein